MDYKDITAYLAWGYHAAALRGEAPMAVSKRAVYEWLKARPIYQAQAAERGEAWAGKWAKGMARLVIVQLERLGVVVPEQREEVV